MDKDWNLKKLYKAVDGIIAQGVGIPQVPQQPNNVPSLVAALDQMAKQNQVSAPVNKGLPELPKLG